MISKDIVKNIASIIEIIIIFITYVIIFSIIFKKYFVKNIQQNWEKNRENPFSFLFKSNNTSSSSMVSGFLSQKTKTLFKPFEKIFYNIFGIFTKIFKYFSKSINEIRNLTKPIRLFFKQSAFIFYKKLQNFMIGITYSIHKMRNSLRRSVSGFNMAFHSLNHMKYSFESIWNSPIPKTAEKVAPVLDFMGNALNTLGLCFDENTEIDTKNGKIKISNIKIGTELKNGSFVISKHKFICPNDMYNYKNIIVSGSHLVKENNKYLRIEDSRFSVKIDYDKNFIYCINTTNNNININGITFSDFSETSNSKFNKIINQIILKKLNNKPNCLNNYIFRFLEQGVDSNTKIFIGNNKYIKIEDINIGDIINDSKVLGKIEIDSKYIDVYSYKNLILSGNVKIMENNLWINVADSEFSILIPDYNKKMYHLITSKSKIILENKLIITDYLECHDPQTNAKIDNIICKLNNR